MKKTVITIARSYGSGGRTLGNLELIATTERF